MTNIYLQYILDKSELDRMIDAKRIKATEHPTLPLTIYNYTDLATYAGEWSNSERVCRGLIIGPDDEIIARGPAKFFNYGEPNATAYPLGTQVRVSRKEDGSLGIGWCYSPDEGDTMHWGVATRGSFTSEQAVHAMSLIDSKRQHDGHYELWYDAVAQYGDNGISYIGEVVYPENRIVLDYGERDDVIPLGVVDNRTGLINWRPFNNSFMTLAEAIAQPIPDDEEGYVLDVLDAHGEVIDHLKLKGARYKELHAAIFGLTERKVWEQMVVGTIDDFIAALPDEVQPWAEVVRQRLFEDHSYLMACIGTAWRFTYILPTRREQAEKIMCDYAELSGAVFAMLDGNDAKVQEWVWKAIKPAHIPFKSVKEEVA